MRLALHGRGNRDAVNSLTRARLSCLAASNALQRFIATQGSNPPLPDCPSTRIRPRRRQTVATHREIAISSLTP
jgi:hypothetical protein